MKKTESSQPMLSKSRFISGLQCPLRLWNEIHHRDAATPWTATQQAIFDRGTRVGELAQQRYPGGVLVGFKPWQRDPALRETQRLLDDPEVPAIYEAAIQHRSVFARVDILQRTPTGWALIEVKASITPGKDVFIRDLALQYWIARGQRLQIESAGILVLDKSYVYAGGEYDLDALFHFGDATEACEAAMPEIRQQAAELIDVAVQTKPPEIDVGDHCSRPYPCPFYEHCTQDMPALDHPIDNLYRIHAGKLDQLRAQGIEEIADIPEDFPLTTIQQRMRQSVRTGEPWCSEDLPRILEQVEWPLYFLDFEAIAPPLPRYAGTSPFQTIPFQYSLHIQTDNGLEHREHLHEHATDPRRPLAEALIEAIGIQGSIIVYSSYERRIIAQLAKTLPDLAGDLHPIMERLWDLLPVVQQHYYHPDFGGSFSIEAVLPVLQPEAGWSNLDITDGFTAALVYENAIDDPDTREPAPTFARLREYCSQDTQAMLRLYSALHEFAQNINGDYQ